MLSIEIWSELHVRLYMWMFINAFKGGELDLSALKEAFS